MALEFPVNADAFRHLIVDGSLYDMGSGSFEYRRDFFGFMEPKRIGYELAPTTLVCGTCGLLKPCASATEMLDFLEGAEEECQDPIRPGPDPKRCRWRQFEPIFVHPSGSWRSTDVSALDIFPGSEEPSRRSSSCEACGYRQFKVDTSKVTLGGWYLKCAKCGVRTSWTWTDNDEDYLRAIRTAGRSAAAPDPDAARMEKISYGAAIAFVPQAESFVDLPESDRLRLIESHRLDELCDFIAGKPDGCPHHRSRRKRRTSSTRAARTHRSWQRASGAPSRRPKGCVRSTRRWPQSRKRQRPRPCRKRSPRGS